MLVLVYSWFSLVLFLASDRSAVILGYGLVQSGFSLGLVQGFILVNSEFIPSLDTAHYILSLVLG